MTLRLLCLGLALLLAAPAPAAEFSVTATGEAVYWHLLNPAPSDSAAGVVLIQTKLRLGAEFRRVDVGGTLTLAGGERTTGCNLTVGQAMLGVELGVHPARGLRLFANGGLGYTFWTALSTDLGGECWTVVSGSATASIAAGAEVVLYQAPQRATILFTGRVGYLDIIGGGANFSPNAITVTLGVGFRY